MGSINNYLTNKSLFLGTNLRKPRISVSDTKASLITSPLLLMSDDKQFRASSEHGEVPAAPLSTTDASLSQSTPSDPLRQADEPPSEATTTPKASQPDSLSKAAEALTELLIDTSAVFGPLEPEWHAHGTLQRMLVRLHVLG